MVAGFAAVAALLLTTGQPTAEEIVARAIARAESQYEDLAYARFEARQVSTTRSLNAEGATTREETLIYREYPLEGALYDELVEKDGQPLTDKEVRSEEKRREKFIREVRRRRSRGGHPQPEEGPGIRFNHDLMDRYRVELAGTETVRGHECWVIRFEPEVGKLPSRTRMDPALNKSTGRLWISQQDYGLAKLEFAMREPFRYWGGLLATIRQAEGLLEFERFAGGTWLPLGFDFRLDLEVLMVKNIRRYITTEWSEHRLADVPEQEVFPDQAFTDTPRIGTISPDPQR